MNCVIVASGGDSLNTMKIKVATLKTLIREAMMGSADIDATLEMINGLVVAKFGKKISTQNLQMVMNNVRQALESDVQSTGGRLPTEEECSAMMSADDDSVDHVPSAGAANFPKTLEELESVWQLAGGW